MALFGEGKKETKEPVEKETQVHKNEAALVSVDKKKEILATIEVVTTEMARLARKMGALQQALSGDVSISDPRFSQVRRANIDLENELKNFRRVCL